jgi:hypothetical protein
MNEDDKKKRQEKRIYIGVPGRKKTGVQRSRNVKNLERKYENNGENI